MSAVDGEKKIGTALLDTRIYINLNKINFFYNNLVSIFMLTLNKSQHKDRDEVRVL